MENLTPNPSPKERGIKYGYITTDSRKYTLLFTQAKLMRIKPTMSEKIMWGNLRKLRSSYVFRRQHIISHFIVDFVCLEKKLIIEIDGDVHINQQERDEERTKILQLANFTVLRFNNTEVINDSIKVTNQIKQALEKS